MRTVLTAAGPVIFKSVPLISESAVIKTGSLTEEKAKKHRQVVPGDSFSVLEKIYPVVPGSSDGRREQLQISDTRLVLRST
jgi:hypothetical protein